MTENDEGIGSGFLESKFWKVFMIILTAFLIFAGPTYVTFIMSDTLKINLDASIIVGFALFIVGILMLVFLIRKKVVT